MNQKNEIKILKEEIKWIKYTMNKYKETITLKGWKKFNDCLNQREKKLDK